MDLEVQQFIKVAFCKESWTLVILLFLWLDPLFVNIWINTWFVSAYHQKLLMFISMIWVLFIIIRRIWKTWSCCKPYEWMCTPTRKLFDYVVNSKSFCWKSKTCCYLSWWLNCFLISSFSCFLFSYHLCDSMFMLIYSFLLGFTSKSSIVCYKFILCFQVEDFWRKAIWQR